MPAANPVIIPVTREKEEPPRHIRVEIVPAPEAAGERVVTISPPPKYGEPATIALPSGEVIPVRVDGARVPAHEHRPVSPNADSVTTLADVVEEGFIEEVEKAHPDDGEK